MTRPKRAAVGVEPEFKESSEEDSATSKKRKQTTKAPKEKAPPAKRPKVERKSKETKNASTTESNEGFQMLPQPKVKGKQKQSLNLQVLVSMPLDILFAIFSHMFPKDLLSLARTSRVFRETLMTRKATTVWKTARERLGAPECPALISEPHWAALLFGKNCQTCGAPNVPNVEFLLLRRACKACKVKHLVLENKITNKTYPGFVPSILEILPSIHKGTVTRKYYWDDDITWILRKMKELNDNLRQEESNANGALEEFRTVRKETIKTLPDNIPGWLKWMFEYENESVIKVISASDLRAQLLRERFKELGYEDDDLEFLNTHAVTYRKAALTDRVWEKTRLELEPEIIFHRNCRLELAQSEVRMARRQIVAQLYTEYKKTLHPSRWKYLQRTLYICLLSVFAKHITADSTIEITALSFKDAFELLPKLLAKSTEDVKVHLRRVSGNPTSPPAPGSLDTVELARHVFKCRENWCEDRLIGSDNVLSHHCQDEGEGIGRPSRTFRNGRKVAYDAAYSSVATEVITAIGLDPETALPNDLTDKDLRFGCLGCLRSSAIGSKPSDDDMICAWTWKALILHIASFRERSDIHHQTTDIVILSPKDAQEAKELEQGDFNWTLPWWICGHCTIHLNDPKEEGDVVQHVKESHGIAEPVRGTDLLYFLRKGNELYESPKIKVPAAMAAQLAKLSLPSETILCLRCTEAASNLKTKLYKLSAVKAHLLSKHQVPYPQDGVDFCTKPGLEE